MNTDHSQDNVILFRPPVTGCARITELLPWFLNGALDASEATEVREHLDACADCRTELADAADVWRLMDQHPESAELAAYVEDPSSLEEPTRADVERHLVTCSECRGLVNPAAEPALPQVPARRRARRTATASSAVSVPTRRGVQSWISVAATLAAVTLLAILGWMTGTAGTSESPTGIVAETTVEAAPDQTATASPDQASSILSAFDWESGTLEPMQGAESDRVFEVVAEPSPPAGDMQPSTDHWRSWLLPSPARAEA